MLPDFSLSTLSELQTYVGEIEIERGFEKEGLLEKCLLLGEEVGELFKSIRTECGIGIDPRSTTRNVGEELADVLIFILAIANRCEVDLGAALKAKEALNCERTWKR